MAWLSGWSKRVKLTIDNTDIDAALSWFPIRVHLGTSVGRNGDDVSFVFDELTENANRKKIAVTKTDGTTELYVEIEKWDDGNEVANLWVSRDGWAIADDADTDLYLYYDSTHANNDTYVGDTNDEVAENVWDANFKFVCHMRDDPDNEHVRDSTSNDNDGTKRTAGGPAITTAGKIADAQDFEGSDVDKITITHDASLNMTSGITFEQWLNPESLATDNYLLTKRDGISTDSNYHFTLHNGYLSFNFYNGAWLGLTDDTRVITTVEGDVKVVVTYDQSDIRLYVNNTEVKTVERTTAMLPNIIDIIIGLRGDGAIPFDGIIDETRLSSIARNAAWLDASYESERDHLLDFGGEEEALTKSLSDSVAIADSPAMQAEFFRSMSDTVAIADSPVKALSLFRADTIAIAESITTKAIGVFKTDAVAVADTFSRAVKFYKSLVDTVAVADTFSRAVKFYKSLVDTVAVADTIIKAFGKFRTETIAIVDEITLILGVISLTLKNRTFAFTLKTRNFAFTLKDRVFSFTLKER